MTSRVLLLTPSCGLGGGIERYVETLEWSFAAQGIEYQRIDLDRAGPAAHVRMLARARKQLRARPQLTRLVVAHRALLPVASLLARERAVSGISVVCHGSDVWGMQLRPRQYVENRLMRHDLVRVVAVSSFTAGVLAEGCPATVLPPGLSAEWFRKLAGACAGRGQRAEETQLVTAFRLEDWQDKGLPQLVEAVRILGRPDVRVIICGSGEPSADLLQLVNEHHFCTLRVGLSDRQLAGQLAAADLFVLATRTRPGRRACGEGFGLVLLEAQLAGTPVVAPAYGGSRDAYIDGITGLAPTDESASALAATLQEMLSDPYRLADMSQHAAEWARERAAPERYAALAAARLL